jgi:hypothetical protein
MAVLATTATEKEISANLKNATAIMSNVDFTDMGRSFKEGDDTFNVFAILPGIWQPEIEAAITRGGKKFKWL